FVGTWVSVSDGSLSPGDQVVHDWTADIENANLTDAANLVTHLADSLVVYVLVAFACFALLMRRRLMEALVLGSGMLLTIAAVHVTKPIVDRPRPPDPLVDVTGSSFPSGHAAYAVAWVALAIVAVRAV